MICRRDLFVMINVGFIGAGNMGFAIMKGSLIAICAATLECMQPLLRFVCLLMIRQRKDKKTFRAGCHALQKRGRGF